MGRKLKTVQLTSEEDTRLRQLEMDPSQPKKVRLRAQIVRLAHAGWHPAQIATYVRRHEQVVKQDLRRFREQGEKGLADKPRPTKPPTWNAQIERFVRDCLAQERAWTCNQLSEAIHEQLQVELKREALRLRLKQMGYTWQRTRYVPAKEADPEEVALAEQLLEVLKKGQKTGKWNYGGWINVA